MNYLPLCEVRVGNVQSLNVNIQAKHSNTIWVRIVNNNDGGLDELKDMIIKKHEAKEANKSTRAPLQRMRTRSYFLHRR